MKGADEWGDGSWTVDCSCGVTFDDGEEMVSCDSCGVWVHTRCAKFIKGEPSFACHNCKRTPPPPPAADDRNPPASDRIPSDNEETEVAQLLAELPLKTGPTSLLPFRKWEVPLQDKVHVQGVPGGDPALFQGNLGSVFNANLWRCTGYVPKKFGFEYVEFPCWKDSDGFSKASQGADALFALSKQAEVAAVSYPQNAIRKIFKIGDSEDRVNKKKDKHRVGGLFLGDCSLKNKDGFRERKDKDKERKKKNKKKDSSYSSMDAKITFIGKSEIPEEREMQTQIEESIIAEGKSETKIEDNLVESNLSDHDVGESFGEINKASAEDLLNLCNVSKVSDDNNNNVNTINNIPDITEKTETNPSNVVQEKVKDESKQETTLTPLNSNNNNDKKNNNKVMVKPEDNNNNNNSNKRADIAEDDISTSQHDVSKAEPGTEESITGAPKASSLTCQQDQSNNNKKHPIIYHAKTSASSLNKTSQGNKVLCNSDTPLKNNNNKKPVDPNVNKPSATCHPVDESTSATSRKVVSDAHAPDPPANLSDEQLALLLHQQLNSSPRVPRVPRLRHTPGVQTTHPTPASVLSKRPSRDHASGVKKRHKEDVVRESSRDSSGMNERGLTNNKSTGQSKSTSVSKDSDKKLPAQHSPTVSSTEAATSPADCTSQKYPSLPGLIDEVLNATQHVTYEEICRNVSMHWTNLRKPNGERYAYSSPSHAVHDILRNRKEWAYLLDQAPKAYLTKKRKNVIIEEKIKLAKLEEEISEESVKEGFLKGKRKARKRRRLELKGNKSLIKGKNKEEKKSGSEKSSGPSDSSSDDDVDGKDDEMVSSDDVSGVRTAGSSSSD